MKQAEIDALLQRNIEKCKELQSSVQWAAFAFVVTSFSRGKYFEVREAYRTQQRQNALYLKGRRGIPGEQPVTWTKNSLHTQRLAMDIYPKNCTHKDLEKIAAWYGITHPLKNDPPHYEFNNVGDPPPPAPPPSTLLKNFLDALTRPISALKRKIIQRGIARLKKRFRLLD